MYQVSPATAAKIESYCRTWRILITDSAGNAALGDAVISADSTADTTSGDDIELGAVCSAEWTVNVTDEAHTQFLGNKYSLSLYLRDYSATPTTWGGIENHTCEYLSHYTVSQLTHLSDLENIIPMGVFTCVKSRRNGKTTTLTLCDALYFADKVYTPSITLPAYASAIENDICTQLGIENANSFEESKLLVDNESTALYTSDSKRLRVLGYDFLITSIEEDTTMRQMLSYIASAMGQFGCIGRDGRYIRRWYIDTVKTIDSNTIDLPDLSEQANRITRLICHKGNTEMSLPAVPEEGRTIEFDNPYMTDFLFSSLWRRLEKQGLVWYTADIYHRLGDPRFDVGDIVELETGEKIPITGLAYTFDGGLSAKIKAAGRSVEEELI